MARHGRWGGRAAVVVGAGLVLGLVGALPAVAHDELIAVVPEEGATVEVAPDVASFTYSATVAAGFTEALVTPPGGAGVPVAAEALVVSGPAVSVPIASLVPDAPAGTWQVVLRIVSSDGHPVESTLTFTTTASASAAAPPASPSPAPSPASVSPSPSSEAASPSSVTELEAARVADGDDGEGGSLPPWLLVGLVVFSLAVSFLGAFLARRRRERPAAEGRDPA